MSEDGRWSIDELVARVAAELEVGYAGAPSGRVRDVPDRRAIRWYTTIGLVDRPLEMRGRTALYGWRHLLQLIAVKRRQAAGRSLAEIQAELAGATDRTLGEIADLPPGNGAPAAPDAADRESGPARTRFWATPATAAPAPGPKPPSPTSPSPESSSSESPDSESLRPGSGGFAGGFSLGVAVAGRAVVLDGGVTVVLPGGGPAVSGEDLAAIGVAAGPLLEVLGRRGLLAVESELEAGAESRDGGRSGGS